MSVIRLRWYNLHFLIFIIIMPNHPTRHQPGTKIYLQLRNRRPSDPCVHIVCIGQKKTFKVEPKMKLNYRRCHKMLMIINWPRFDFGCLYGCLRFLLDSYIRVWWWMSGILYMYVVRFRSKMVCRLAKPVYGWRLHILLENEYSQLYIDSFQIPVSCGSIKILYQCLNVIVVKNPYPKLALPNIIFD